MPLQSCKECNKEISVEAKTCPSCGAPQRKTNGNKKRLIYVLLAISLGYLGAHNFYAGYTKKAIIQLAITLILGWLAIGIIISGIWAIIDALTITKDAEEVEFL